MAIDANGRLGMLLSERQQSAIEQAEPDKVCHQEHVRTATEAKPPAYDDAGILVAQR